MQMTLLKFSKNLKYKLSYECKENIDLCINHSPGRNYLYNKELHLMEDLYKVRQQIGILE